MGAVNSWRRPTIVPRFEPSTGCATTLYSVAINRLEDLMRSEAGEAADSARYDLQYSIDEQRERIDELERRQALGW